VFVSLNLFDVRRILTFEILLNKSLEKLDILKRLALLCITKRSNAEQLQNFYTRLFGKRTRTVELAPRRVWVARWLFVRP
jgi:hypothetical protein